ncbi:NAC domain-containing protein 83-like [Impatiens glandulifera]|uniref:NAC domain-containing protein 83-like n=1 Tax=Impatiens glandulifera TaxID=253017 RepID=UPI001FB104C7|nr:NAC domain-containing protein 83-like [Impatiens glandulifera]
MEKSGFFVTNGVNLPIGFRFRPTDDELIVHYLNRKAMSLPLPVSVIPDVEVFSSSPWDLPGDLEETKYFFSRGREGTTCNGKKVRISDGSGFWKVSGKEKHVFVFGKKGREVIGVRKTMTFFHGKNSDGLKSSWVMHEIKLSNNSIQKPGGGEWKVYRIYKKKNRVKCNNRYRICPPLPPQTTSSPCSSVITCEESDDGEETKSCF